MFIKLLKLSCTFLFPIVAMSAESDNFTLTCKSIDRIDSMQLIRLQYEASSERATASIFGAFVEGGVFHPIIDSPVKRLREAPALGNDFTVRSKKITLRFSTDRQNARLITKKWIERPLPYGCHWCLISIPVLETKSYALENCTLDN